MTDEAPDFSGVANTAPREDHLQMLVEMVATLRELEAEVAAAEVALAAKTKRLNDFQLVALPEAMELAGVGEYVLAGPQAQALGLAGVKLVVKDDLKASISEANRALAHKWLREHGHGGVVKAGWKIDLRAVDESTIDLLKGAMRVHDIVPEDVESVHPATLKSLVKELLEKGTTLPPSISVFQFKKAELKEPKARK